MNNIEECTLCVVTLSENDEVYEQSGLFYCKECYNRMINAKKCGKCGKDEENLYILFGELICDECCNNKLDEVETIHF